jgi:hypothetical protein
MYNEGPCLSLAPNSLHHQQSSGLNLIDVQTQKIRYIRAIRENPTSFVMNKNVCGMTNFDGIRCQELPSSITSSFQPLDVIPGAAAQSPALR